MRPIHELDVSSLKTVAAVLTDMDETLTFRGRLSAATYKCLENLQEAGVKVIVNTAAPAGWCDQMARMWPVDGVIGENGGLFFRRNEEHGVLREFWHNDATAVSRKLEDLSREVRRQYPELELADDQPFRQTSLAFKRVPDQGIQKEIIDAFQALGARGTANNLWLLAWFGEYDKLSMARRVLSKHFSLDIDKDRKRIAYAGDSENDGPMFAFFEHTFGMSTVVEALDRLEAPPAWLTDGPGGSGFVEVGKAVIEAQTVKR